MISCNNQAGRNLVEAAEFNNGQYDFSDKRVEREEVNNKVDSPLRNIKNILEVKILIDLDDF